MNGTQRENPEWRHAPRRARGSVEHYDGLRGIVGHERYDARRDVVPRRCPLAMALRVRTQSTGRPTRQVYWATLRNMQRRLLIIDSTL